MTAQPLLEACGLVKRFGGVTALDGVSFDLRPGELHSLCGENGAGKSTLIKLLSGIHAHGTFTGSILLDGKPAEFRSTRDSEKAGIAIVHQELALFPEMTVAENMFLGALPTRLGRIEWERVMSDAASLLRRWDIALDPASVVGELGVGRQQLVEIARALARSPRVLVLDEPTAALARQEIDVLLSIVRRLKGQGVSCIYISHKLDEVFAVADRITVLRDGRSQGTLDAAATGPAEVIRLMVGRPIENLYPRRTVTPGEVLLQVDGLAVAPARGTAPRLEDIAFEVRAGEVLGIGGLMGAGRSELLMHLFGLWGERGAGSVRVRGRDFPQATPRDALAAGLALVTEDRKRFGLVAGQDIVFNLTLSSLHQVAHGPQIDRDRELAQARGSVQQLGIRSSSGLEAPVSSLSGGNQQKVVLGKALMTRPGILLLDEPTRGIDVGAKLEVYGIVNRLTAEGCAVVLVSSELEELLGMSDRILMLHGGRPGGTFERGQATPERLLAAAMGRGLEAA